MVDDGEDAIRSECRIAQEIRALSLRRVTVDVGW